MKLLIFSFLSFADKKTYLFVISEFLKLFNDLLFSVLEVLEIIFGNHALFRFGNEAEFQPQRDPKKIPNFFICKCLLIFLTHSGSVK